MRLVYYTPPPPPPPAFYISVVPISTGYYIRSKKNQRQWFCKIFFPLGVAGGGRGEGVNKVYYGLCGIGEYFYFFSPKISHLDPP